MKYKMTVVIYNPNTKTGNNSDIVFKLTATFFKNDDTYGNKHYVNITDCHGFDNHYDIRYDTSFRENNKAEWLECWARNYWTGKDGAYAIKELKIEKAGD